MVIFCYVVVRFIWENLCERHVENVKYYKNKDGYYTWSSSCKAILSFLKLMCLFFFSLWNFFIANVFIFLSWIYSAISSHLQTCGCSVVVGSSAEKINKVIYFIIQQIICLFNTANIWIIIQRLGHSQDDLIV